MEAGGGPGGGAGTDVATASLYTAGGYYNDTTTE